MAGKTPAICMYRQNMGVLHVVIGIGVLVKNLPQRLKYSENSCIIDSVVQTNQRGHTYGEK